MRISALTSPVLSSMLCQRPTGVICAMAERGGSEPGRSLRQGNLRMGLLANERWLQASAASVFISGALPARAVRISVAVSGNSLAK